MVALFITIIPCQQDTGCIDASSLAGSHISRGRRRCCYLWSLPTAALVASKEPHCAHYDRSSTPADTWPTPGRYFAAMWHALLRRSSFLPMPPTPHPPILSFFSSNDVVSYQACHHTWCLAEVHLALATLAMPSHVTTFAWQRQHCPHPLPPSSHLVLWWDVMLRPARHVSPRSILPWQSRSLAHVDYTRCLVVTLVTCGLWVLANKPTVCCLQELEVLVKNMDYLPLEYVVELCCMITMPSFLCDGTMMSRYTMPLKYMCS